MNLNRLNILKFTIIALFLSSCSDDDSNDNVVETTGNAFAVSLKTTGGNETEFIVGVDDLMSGEITAENNGIEQTGWRFYYPVNNTLFATGYTDDNLGQSYIANNEGEIEQLSEFTFNNALEMFGTDDDSSLLAMETARTEDAIRIIRVVNANTGEVELVHDIEIFQDGDISGWPTAIEVRGDNMFIPFHKLILPSFETPDQDTAYVAVYSYPIVEGEVPTIISDDRTGNLGVNGFTTGLIEADNGNLYGYSCGSVMAGFSAQSTKPSGIIKINSGETEFDQDYFFNVEEAAGGKIFSWDYAGNNKALARILSSESGIAWDAYSRSETAFNQKLVVIDLEEQTVTDVTDIPLHALRYSSPLLIEDGLTYLSVETATEAYVYRVNIEEATADQGAEIIGKTIKGFYKLQ